MARAFLPWPFRAFLADFLLRCVRFANVVAPLSQKVVLDWNSRPEWEGAKTLEMGGSEFTSLQGYQNRRLDQN